MKTEVSVVTFCQKGHKLYYPGDIILVMKMKAIVRKSTRLGISST